MNGQVAMYVAGSLLATGAWVAVGVFGRRIWDRLTNHTGRPR